MLSHRFITRASWLLPCFCIRYALYRSVDVYMYVHTCTYSALRSSTRTGAASLSASHSGFGIPVPRPSGARSAGSGAYRAVSAPDQRLSDRKSTENSLCNGNVEFMEISITIHHQSAIQRRVPREWVTHWTKSLGSTVDCVGQRAQEDSVT